MAGPRLVECGTNVTLADPEAPHSCTDKPRGPGSEWWRTGQAERQVAPLGLTFAQINLDEWWDPERWRIV